MDAQRFDNLARTLAGRLSRRGALRRVGAAAATSVLASARLRPNQVFAQDQDANQPVYGVVRRYSLSGPTSQVRAALQKGYIDDACKALEPVSHGYWAVGGSERYPVQPPRRAMVQAAQARLSGANGFCCLRVRPCSFFCKARSTSICSGVKTRLAGAS